jgi:biopolymer transport protein ExbD
MSENNKSMKKAYPATKRAKKSTSKEIELFDLDVTPVMNLFMVLIPFLVSMAVFTHLAVVDFSLPPANTPSQENTDNK